MKICLISDTHMHHKKIIIPKCDMIIHAGDFTYHGEEDEVDKFLNWYEELPIKYKILVCGNHEKGVVNDYLNFQQKCRDRCITLLRNEHAIIEGFTIFGSPYSVRYGPWAYGMIDDDLANIWNMASPDTDIFISHGPPQGILDLTLGNVNAGSKTLLNHLDNELPNLKLCVFGHIHESRGTLLRNGVLFVNASICGIPYVNTIINPITVEITK